MQQTKLSLQLRKRNLERSESVIPPGKRQNKDDIQGPISAFGAPHLEERKITKRTINVKSTTTIEQTTKKRDIKQATLKQLVKSAPTTEQLPTINTNVETRSTTESNTAVLNQQEVATTEETSSPTNTTRNEPTENVSTSDDSVSSSSGTTPTTEFESAPVSNSPSSSPTSIGTKSPKDTSISPLIEDNNTTTPPLSSLTTLSSSATTVPENLPSKPSSSVVYTKSTLPKFDKGRITEERSLLDKLVSALDITLTFHAARNVAAFFHKIQPMLRNSTCKNVTLSHLCKILFVAPELYDVETKLLKEYNKETEAHQVSIGSMWVIPLSGKVMQERKDLMTKRSGDYFEKHTEANSTIPEKELPRLDKVVDKKKWLQNATLPDRVRSILELQEKRKVEKEAKANQPRIEPKGTAKDRAKALLDRIRNKQKK